MGTTTGKRVRIRARKCQHCKRFFIPDPRVRDGVKRDIQKGKRSRRGQHYCAEPACQKASRRDSQRRWFGKAANRKYFRGKPHVDRAKEWRAKHRGRPRRRPKRPLGLQDMTDAQAVENQYPKAGLTELGLNDSMIVQPAFIVGLIAHITGFGLHDDIGDAIRKVQATGQAILGGVPGTQT